MATAKECNSLISYYAARYVKTYGHRPVFNAYKSRWGFDSILLSLTPKEVTDLIDFYFTTPSVNNHALDWFFYNYDKLQESMAMVRADAERTSKLRQETKERTEEWRRTNLGYDGIESAKCGPTE